jgi:hypothetical protein
MNNKFTPPVPVIENLPLELGMTCTTEESEARLLLCKSCINFSFDNNVTICNATNCNISLMTTFKFKQCPLEKW